MTITLTKREEKLRKKERQIEEDLVEREKLEKEVEKLNREMSSLQSLTKGQEQALAKKDKQLQDNQEELGELRRIHEQIFNLSKLRGSKWKGVKNLTFLVRLSVHKLNLHTCSILSTFQMTHIVQKTLTHF